MAEEKKLSQLDVKDIFSKINSQSLLKNKSIVYVTASFILCLILCYLIYGLYVNQDVYESQKQRFNLASNKVNNTQKEIESINSKNKAYIKQLSKASKTKSELSSKITKLIGNYGLEIKNMDLKTNQNGVSSSMVLELCDVEKLLETTLDVRKLLKNSQLKNCDVALLTERYPRIPSVCLRAFVSQTESSEQLHRWMGASWVKD